MDGEHLYVHPGREDKILFIKGAILHGTWKPCYPIFKPLKLGKLKAALS